ncbi:hypothetical protein [Actinomadura sp. K4S16]|uniref:hypothetical protein n=1 Tax=Actinomadura sp. K4S16 TaxID=1316147 RepID=UPI0011EBCB25|nr:hypothetical protein [Actinomadura sp. K4S16]
MEIDHIRALACDYAAKLNVGEPAVRQARFSSWAPTGLRPRMSRRRPVLIVDTRFDGLETAEKEAAIAGALVGAATSPRYWRHMGWTGFLLLLMALIMGGVSASLSGWAEPVPLVVSPAFSLLVTAQVHRRFVYAVDRATVEAFGWAVIDASLELHRRTPFKYLDPQRLYTPKWEQRMARLDRLRESGGPKVPARPAN